MLTYNLENIDNMPIYQYLYNCLRQDILKGILKANDRLPSKRAFAENLGISVITVENAYSQLYAEGYIYSVAKKGYYVSNLSLPVEHSTNNSHNRHKPENLDYSEDKSRKLIADFTGNRIEPTCFPFSIWARLSRQVINNNKEELVTNAPCAGVQNLRNAIANHLLEYRNLNVDPAQIIIGAGTEYLYGLLIQLLGFDKHYGVEDPSYNKIYKVYNGHRVQCRYISMDKYGVIPEELEKNEIDVIHISPSHHYPTGIVMPINRRMELLGWAANKEERYIIEDDYDTEFRMTGKAIPAMQNIDHLEKVIYINTFTKTLSSTVRISYMVLPPHLVKKFYKEMSFYSCTVSNFEQYTLAEFIEGGYFEKHINRMRNYYHKKRDLIIREIMESPLNEYAEIYEQDAGLHFILRLKTNLSDEDIVKKTERQNIKISALSGFYHTIPKHISHLFVINYSSVNDKCIRPAIKVIYDTIVNSRI